MTVAGALNHLRNESLWIGLNDLKAPNIFTWIDKEPLTYSK